jgi:hypothetical protein
LHTCHLGSDSRRSSKGMALQVLVGLLAPMLQVGVGCK